MIPPHERLEALDAASPEVDDRLVVQGELAADQRPPEVGLHLEELERAPVHRRLEHDALALAVGLRRVHRGVRVADQVVRLGGRAVVERDPHAGADEDLPAADLKRLLQRREDPLGKRECGFLAHGVL